MNKTKGVNVMLFFICSFILFVGTTFWFVWSENSTAKQAVVVAREAVIKADTFDDKIAELRKADEYNGKHLEETRQILDKLTKRIEWAEMKASIPTTKIVQSTQPLKVEPITVNVVYKRKQNKVTAETKVIKSVRDKMKSVNQ